MAVDAALDTAGIASSTAELRTETRSTPAMRFVSFWSILAANALPAAVAAATDDEIAFFFARRPDPKAFPQASVGVAPEMPIIRPSSRSWSLPLVLSEAIEMSSRSCADEVAPPTHSPTALARALEGETMSSQDDVVRVRPLAGLSARLLWVIDDGEHAPKAFQPDEGVPTFQGEGFSGLENIKCGLQVPAGEIWLSLSLAPSALLALKPVPFLARGECEGVEAPERRMYFKAESLPSCTSKASGVCVAMSRALANGGEEDV